MMRARRPSTYKTSAAARNTVNRSSTTYHDNEYGSRNAITDRVRARRAFVGSVIRCNGGAAPARVSRITRLVRARRSPVQTFTGYNTHVPCAMMSTYNTHIDERVRNCVVVVYAVSAHFKCTRAKSCKILHDNRIIWYLRVS